MFQINKVTKSTRDYIYTNIMRSLLAKPLQLLCRVPAVFLSYFFLLCNLENVTYWNIKQKPKCSEAAVKMFSPES